MTTRATSIANESSEMDALRGIEIARAVDGKTVRGFAVARAWKENQTRFSRRATRARTETAFRRVSPRAVFARRPRRGEIRLKKLVC